jgi:hypothetical protein
MNAHKIALLARHALVGVLLLAASACGRRVAIDVRDYDTYQTITLGSVAYTTVAGVRVTGQERNRVLHAIDSIPQGRFVVEYDVNPPRDFRLDGEAEKRRFLETVIPGGTLTSAQYSERTDWKRTARTEARGPESFEQVLTQRLKVMARGITDDRQPIGAVVVMSRQQGRTIIIRGAGRLQDIVAINREVERLADAIEW